MPTCGPEVDFDVPGDEIGIAFPDENTALDALANALQDLADKARTAAKKPCNGACNPHGGAQFQCKQQFQEKLSDLGAVSSFRDRQHTLPEGTKTTIWWKVVVGGGFDAKGAPAAPRKGHSICVCCPVPPPAAPAGADAAAPKVDPGADAPKKP